MYNAIINISTLEHVSLEILHNHARIEDSILMVFKSEKQTLSLQNMNMSKTIRLTDETTQRPSGAYSDGIIYIIIEFSLALFICYFGQRNMSV